MSASDRPATRDTQDIGSGVLNSHHNCSSLFFSYFVVKSLRQTLWDSGHRTNVRRQRDGIYFD